MIGFRCIPMDTESAMRFRQTGRDDAGNLLHRKIADHPSPCRHCLAEAEIGAPVLLGSYHFGRPHGVYWTASPIFLHAESCERFERADFIPERLRAALSAPPKLIGARELGLMKPSAYLINTARGRIVDEPALVRALQDGAIGIFGHGRTRSMPEAHSTRMPRPRAA